MNEKIEKYRFIISHKIVYKFNGGLSLPFSHVKEMVSNLEVPC